MGNSHTKITSGQRERNLENRKQFFESSFSRLLGGQNNNITVREGIDETPLKAAVIALQLKGESPKRFIWPLTVM